MAIYCSRTFKREEIKDKVWAIIGMGRIGVQVSDLVARNGVINGSCLGFDRGSSFKSLKKCDIVSLHITADEENRGFMSQKMFEQMKDGAIFLNSAREWLVEEKALKWALNNKLAGCWTDFDLPFTHPKLITTPHLGGSTKESRAKTELIIAKKLVKLYGST
jgi:D-3-phosphoglycerate dehydrogenase